MELHALAVVVCWWLVSARAVMSASSTNEALEDHLAIDNCEKHKTQPPADLKGIGNLKCTTATDEKRSKYTYFDNERLTIGNTTVYTVFQGLLNFAGNTPEYCFGPNNRLESFDINFTSDTQNDISRVEFTACRTGGYWTNGKVFCSPQECGRFLRQPEADYFIEDLSVTVNMKDLHELPDGTSIIKFIGGPDHRLVYDVTNNITHYYETNDFLQLCEDDGPCYKGKFLSNDNLLYFQGGWPPLVMQKMGDKVFIGLRYDPRIFIFPEKSLDKPCVYTEDDDFGMCTTPSGYHTWQKLWEKSLPYKKEWLSLTFKTYWSYTTDCFIEVIDNDTNEYLVDFIGPCGRYADMRLGNYPYPKVGVYSRGGATGEVKMRFRDIMLNQVGPF